MVEGGICFPVECFSLRPKLDSYHYMMKTVVSYSQMVWYINNSMPRNLNLFAIVLLNHPFCLYLFR